LFFPLSSPTGLFFLFCRLLLLSPLLFFLFFFQATVVVRCSLWLFLSYLFWLSFFCSFFFSPRQGCSHVPSLFETGESLSFPPPSPILSLRVPYCGVFHQQGNLAETFSPFFFFPFFSYRPPQKEEKVGALPFSLHDDSLFPFFFPFFPPRFIFAPNGRTACPFFFFPHPRQITTGLLSFFFSLFFSPH